MQLGKDVGSLKAATTGRMSWPDCLAVMLSVGGPVMKILIAYDGSECAEAAIADLQWAGLPREAEARIISVSEMVLPPPMSYTLPSAGAIELQKMFESNALRQAQEAGKRVQSIFPDWAVGVEAHPGSPASAIIALADDWQPDLIVVGSHGRSRLGRFVLGSVSQTVLNEAHCSVRVARGPAADGTEEESGPVRILVGIDGSEISDAAVAVIAARNWPAGTQVRILNADFNITPMGSEYVLAAISQWIAEERARVARSVETARRKVEAAGLEAQVVTRPGEPKELLLEEIDIWKPDTIFLGARNLTRGGRLRLGSVSSAIAARAHCSVEVVRLATTSR
jgi:nucleotide-binding universal stress UspA family protein